MIQTCPFASLFPFLWDWSKTHPLFTSRSFSPIYEQQFMGAGQFLATIVEHSKVTPHQQSASPTLPLDFFVFVRRGFDHVVAPFSHAVTVSH